MTKIISFLVAAICCTVIELNVQAQVPDRNYLNVRSMESNGPAVRAARDFWKRHGDRLNENWFRLDQGFLAEYREDGIFDRSVYDKKGSWLYSIREYGEKQLPGDVRRIVKSTYYDHSIGYVKEVTQGQILFYVVHIENQEEWKDLLVRDGEIFISKEYSK